MVVKCPTYSFVIFVSDHSLEYDIWKKTNVAHLLKSVFQRNRTLIQSTDAIEIIKYIQ